MPALITGAHPAARPRLVLDGPGREGRADYERRGGYRPGLEGQDLVIPEKHVTPVRGAHGIGYAGFSAAFNAHTLGSRC